MPYSTVSKAQKIILPIGNQLDVYNTRIGLTDVSDIGWYRYPCVTTVAV
jgi:hypothetical protein